MKTKIFILLLFFSIIPVIGAVDVRSDESPLALFQEAGDLYAEGNYCRAAQIYSDLIEMGFSNSTLFYNMGNSYFRCGELGEAIMYFEKAKRISPRDRDISHNLTFARQKVTEIEKERDLITVVFDSIVFLLSKTELFVLEGTAAILLAASLILYLVSRRRKRKKTFKAIAHVTGGVVLLSMLLLLVRVIDERNTEAIVTVEHVEALSGPGGDNMKVLSLPEGMKVWVDEEKGEWYLIHVSTGRGGWVKKDTIGII